MRLEGRHAVIEALRAGMPLKVVFIANGVNADRAIDEIEQQAKKAGVPIRSVPRKDLDSKSERGAHQGVIAEAVDFRFTPLETIMARATNEESALVIALDHVTDPGNLGAVARTAEVVGASGLVVPSRRSAAITPAAWKAAAGALAHVAVAQETNLVRALERFKSAGFWIAGATETAAQTVWDAPLEGRIVLVLGSEGRGLSRLTAERCDLLVSLPQAGRVGSLNVAQAATAISYEWMRRNRRDA